MYRNHPAHSFVYADVFPTVWCPGCGIGTVLASFIDAFKEMDGLKSGVNAVCGTGCTGKIAECLKIPSFSVSNGRVVDYAARAREKNPDQPIAAFVNNADLLLSGAEDLIKSGREKLDLTVVFINNFVCAVSQSWIQPMTPFMRRGADKKEDVPYNIPYLAESAGAAYMARWTPLRAGWLKYSFIDALTAKGLAVIEIISPCLIYDANTRMILSAADRIQFYNDRTEIRNNEPVENLDLRNPEKIIIGKFIDRNGRDRL